MARNCCLWERLGVSGETEDTFGSPTDVVVAANGDIFIASGHKGCNCPNSHIVKFSGDGKFAKQTGKKGSGPGELDQRHSLAFDRAVNRGRSFDESHPDF
jgi:hypothetical protein